MEKCSICLSELKFSNTPLFDSGKIKDGIICTKCLRRINNVDPSIISKLKNIQISDIQYLLQNQPSNKNKFTKEAVQGCAIIVVIIIVIGTIIGMCTSGGSNDEKNLTQTQKDSIAHINWIKNQFNAWDGSHSETEKLIKLSMNNPDSYKHVETKYRDFGKMGLIIYTTFRGTNVYGGIVTNNAISKIDSTGKVYDFKILTE